MSNIKSSHLSNGLVVLSEHMPQAHGVAISTLVDASPQHETPEQSGLAHLCEHAFFLGTKTRDEQVFAALIDSAGGQLGGFTARDYTCLHATISSDYVTYAIDLLGEMLTNSEYTEERLQTEIGVIGHEIDAHEDTTGTWLDSKLKQAMWPDDPLARSILGTKDSLASFSKDDVQGFVKSQYTPDRIVIAAAGQVDHDDFVEQVYDSMWQLEGTDCRTDEETIATPQGGVVVQQREQRLANVSVMVPSPVYSDEDRYSLHVLVSLLGGGMSSRLYSEIREKLGLAYSVSACWNAYGRGGVINIELATSPDSVMPAIMGVFNQLAALAFDAESITDEELWKAKMQVKGQAFLASDSIQTRVSRLATQQLYFDAPIPLEDLLRDIEAVEMDSVRRVAHRVFSSGLSASSVGVAGLVDAEEAVYSGIADLRSCFEQTANQIP